MPTITGPVCTPCVIAPINVSRSDSHRCSAFAASLYLPRAEGADGDDVFDINSLAVVPIPSLDAGKHTLPCPGANCCCYALLVKEEAPCSTIHLHHKMNAKPNPARPWPSLGCGQTVSLSAASGLRCGCTFPRPVGLPARWSAHLAFVVVALPPDLQPQCLCHWEVELHVAYRTSPPPYRGDSAGPCPDMCVS